MTRRWVCPKCGDGCHAPSRPRRDDVRRFCLPCSAKSGRLVERTCPARETAAKTAQERRGAAAAKRAEARKVKQAADRALKQVAGAARQVLRAAPITQVYRSTTPEALEVAFKRYAKLAAWERDLSAVEVSFRRSATKSHTSGRAWPSSQMRLPAAQCPRPSRPGRVVVTVGTDAADSPHAVILHELAHIAAGPDAHHDARWRSFFLLAASEVVGERVEVPGGLNKNDFHRAVRDRLAVHILGEVPEMSPPVVPGPAEREALNFERFGPRTPKNRTRHRSLDRLAHDARVFEIWDEGSDGLWASLVEGYNWEGCSTLHEYTPGDLIKAAGLIEEGKPS